MSRHIGTVLVIMLDLLSVSWFTVTIWLLYICRAEESFQLKFGTICMSVERKHSQLYFIMLSNMSL